MKRALSLIIVLAMVLCMIPFSAFAADFNVGTDFVDGVITLPADGEVSYLWTATEDGTLSITAEAVVPEVAEGEALPTLPDAYILVDGAEYTDAIAVVAGQSYELSFGDNNMVGGDVTVVTNLVGLPGTESNPYAMYNPATGMGDGNNVTVSVEPGASVYYNLYYYANTTVKISGEGVKVVKGEETVDGTEAGYVEFPFAGNERIVLIKITNKAETAQTYTVEAIVPVGTMDNPEVVTSGEYQAELAAGNQGYYYTYFAEGNGTVDVSVYAQDAEGNTLMTILAVNNLTQYIYGDQTDAGFWSVDVATGDEIMIMVTTLNPDDYWNAPAGTVTTVITFNEAVEEPETGIEWGSVLGGVTSHTNETDAEVFYTYTAEQDGMLYRSDYGFNMLVSAGDLVNIYIAPGETVEIYYAAPVAMIGEVEYYYIDEALASAAAGDTIVLKDDVVLEWDGVSLKPGINLNLGEYTLTAPYVIAFGEVTGVVGSASIVADDVMLNNVTIDGVEYAWTEGEGAYTLVEYKAPVVEDEEPIVAEFGGEQMSLSAALAAAAASAPTAENRAVVTLIANAEVDYNVIIDPYVTLNIAGYTLTAPNVIGLTGSMINATAPSDDACATGGKIYVPSSKNMIMSAEVHAGANAGYDLLPVWWEDHYLFTQVKFSTDSFSTDGDAVNIDLKNGWTGKVKNKILNDKDGDVSENALAFVVQAGWLDGPLKVEQKYYFTENSTNSATNGAMYGGGSTGASIVTDYWMQALVVSDCGATVYGAKHILTDYL